MCYFWNENIKTKEHTGQNKDYIVIAFMLTNASNSVVY